MLSKARTITGAAVAAAGLLALATPAFAADAQWDNDDHGSADHWTHNVHHNHEYNGVNVGNDNNVQVPIGVCNNNVAVLGAVVPILSPQSADSCSTAVINQGGGHHEGPPPTSETPPPTSETPPPTSETPPPSSGETTPPSAVGGSTLPEAPAATPVSGHSAVTG